MANFHRECLILSDIARRHLPLYEIEVVACENLSSKCYFAGCVGMLGSPEASLSTLT